MSEPAHKEEEWEMVEREEEPKREENEGPSPPQQRKEAQRKHEVGSQCATLVYCLLCCLDAAVKMGAVATQVARRGCGAAAALVCKAERALAPAVASLRGAAADYAWLLRQGDVRGAAGLAAGHASRAAGRVRAALRWATDAAASAWASAGFTTGMGSHSPRLGATQAPHGAAAPTPGRAFHASAQALRRHASELRRRVAAAARSSYEALDPERKLAGLAAGSQRLPAATCLMLAGGAGLLATAAALTVHIVWG
ncbi:hypothetical protein ABPG75_007965 [Micractinium tetrahymenae]